MHYAIALIEYTKLCQPLHQAKQKVEKLKHDISEAEQKQLEKENEVRLSLSLSLDTLIFFVDPTIENDGSQSSHRCE